MKAGKYHEQITIEENSIGNSYEKLFARFFANEDLEFVEIDDAYIKSRHQVTWTIYWVVNRFI